MDNYNLGHSSGNTGHNTVESYPAAASSQYFGVPVSHHTHSSLKAQPGSFDVSSPDFGHLFREDLYDDRDTGSTFKSLPASKFTNVTILTESPLGSGSYGTVYKAVCDNSLVCAAKVIHSNLHVHEGPKSPRARFWQECKFLSYLRHPNIVQYLGTARHEESRVLLMELMDQSLTTYLRSIKSPLPYHVQIGICHDVALALSFLHAKGIIHRDLTSNNVLMIGDRMAKVTDFGVAKHEDDMATKQTSCPGTTIYMPPEALDNSPESFYDSSIDCFSFGVLSLQVLTLDIPKASPLISAGKIVPELE